MPQPEHTILLNLYDKLADLRPTLVSEIFLRKKRVEALTEWREARFYWLHFNQENNRSESPFLREIQQSTILFGEEYQKSYKAQLRQLLNELVTPLESVVRKEIEQVSAENTTKPPIGALVVDWQR